MEDIENNPWAVRELEEFLYFCCPECDERNQSKEFFLQHALEKHPKAKICLENFSSQEDKIVTKQQNLLDQNSYVHEGLKKERKFENSSTNLKSDSKHKCYICFEEFKMTTKLTNHMKLVHGTNKILKCDLCEKAFTVRQNLRDHVSSVHEGLKKYRCKICEQSFSFKSGVAIHMQQVHNNPFKEKEDFEEEENFQN